MLLALFFAWNVSQTFKELEAKQSIMIHCVKASVHTHFYINNWGVCFDGRAFRISVTAGLIVEVLFKLFSVRNGMKIREYKA